MNKNKTDACFVDGQYYFPNEFENRNVVALPDRVWTVDLFSSPAPLAGGGPLKILLIIDVGSKEFLCLHPFKSRAGVASRLIVKVMSRVIKDRFYKKTIKGGSFDFPRELLLHTDRGSEFTSKEYQRLFETFPFLIGSMSRANTPTDNAVAERAVGTVKNSIPEAGIWPSSFASMTEAFTFIESRREYLNNNWVGRTTCGLTAAKFKERLNSCERPPPKVVAHYNFQGLPDPTTIEIIDYKRHASFSGELGEGRKLVKTIYETGAGVDTLLGRADSIMSQLSNLTSATESIGEQVEQLVNKQKSPRKTYFELPLRDRADGAILDYLLNIPKPRNYRRYAWSRCRIAIVLLRWLGSRASDVAQITLAQLNQGVAQGHFQIYQPKTNSYRTVVLCSRAKMDLVKVNQDIKQVFGDEESKPLASGQTSNNLVHPNRWLITLNDFIKQATCKFNLKLTSHSFRVNYITSLLRSTPLEKVSKIVGHADIRTTVRYDRYVIDSSALNDKLNEIS